MYYSPLNGSKCNLSQYSYGQMNLLIRFWVWFTVTCLHWVKPAGVHPFQSYYHYSYNNDSTNFVMQRPCNNESKAPYPFYILASLLYIYMYWVSFCLLCCNTSCTLYDNWNCLIPGCMTLSRTILLKSGKPYTVYCLRLSERLQR